MHAMQPSTVDVYGQSPGMKKKPAHAFGNSLPARHPEVTLPSADNSRTSRGGKKLRDGSERHSQASISRESARKVNKKAVAQAKQHLE